MNADTPTLSLEEVDQFLRYWSDTTGVGHVTLVAIMPDGGTSASTFRVADADARDAWITKAQSEGRNVYWQVNETFLECSRKPSKADMMAALARNGDLDPDYGLPLPEERERLHRLARYLIADPTFPPTCIIDSGNGVQPIWATKREVLAPAIIARIEAETQAIETALGAGGTHNIDRLLRLPGTVNYPNAKKLREGRTICRARLIHCADVVYSADQAAGLAAHLTAYLGDTGLVRLKAKAAAAPEKNSAIAALISTLEAADADAISAPDHLADDLSKRLSAAAASRPSLRNRLSGSVADLKDAGRDTSRSGLDFSLSAMLKAADFTVTETALILCAFPSGRANADWPMGGRLRYAARTALRSHDPAAKPPLPSPDDYGTIRTKPRATAADDPPDDQADPAEPEPPPPPIDDPGFHQAKKTAATPEHGSLVTEGSVSDAFAIEHANGLLYCHHTGKWFVWDDIRWRKEETKLAFRWAHQKAKQLAADAGKASAIIQCGKAAFAGGVERLAQSDRRLACTSEVWDTDPWLLGTPAGTVDLRTGILRAPDPKDRITKLTSGGPAETPECPLWLNFLDQACAGNAGYIRFLRQWWGYNLTGSTKEHALLFVHGPGGNGKSVMLNTVSHILGDYCTVAPMDTFIESKGDRHPTDLAALRGARMVCASETEEGRQWSGQRINQLTGGDPISARFMRQDFFEYKPAFKLTVIGNNQPELRHVDDAHKRRFNMGPFLFKPERPDKDLEEKLRAEAPAILRWMIDGCLDWQMHGLIRADVVTASTQEYFSEQDMLAQWLDEMCERTDRDDIPTKDTVGNLYRSWSNYTKGRGEDPGSSKSFGMAMRKRGFAPFINAHAVKGRGFLGIKVKESFEPPPGDER